MLSILRKKHELYKLNDKHLWVVKGFFSIIFIIFYNFYFYTVSFFRNGPFVMFVYSIYLANKTNKS